MELAIWLLVLGSVISTQGGPPQVGDKAPDFSLPDQDGTMVKLGDFRGKKSVVLAFFIKAFTPT